MLFGQKVNIEKSIYTRIKTLGRRSKLRLKSEKATDMGFQKCYGLLTMYKAERRQLYKRLTIFRIFSYIFFYYRKF